MARSPDIAKVREALRPSRPPRAYRRGGVKAAVKALRRLRPEVGPELGQPVDAEPVSR